MADDMTNPSEEIVGNSVMMVDDDNNKPTICSLKDLQVTMPDDIRDHLARQYQANNDSCENSADTIILPESYARMDRILLAMKTPPSATTCRVNLIHGNREETQQEIVKELQRRSLDTVFEVRPHPDFPDVLFVDQKGSSSQTTTNDTPTATDRLSRNAPPISPDAIVLFPSWTSRSNAGWPLAHRAVIVDRFCGEAVLRGAHIFVRGILAADRGIQPDDTVAVYADIRPTAGGKDVTVNRGLALEQYKGRTCVYLGLGVAQHSRSDLFRLQKGVGIEMLLEPEARVGPILPPISGILPSKIFFQNLPSMVVAHALSPQPGDTIIDMCAAPGGKTSHVASLVNNNATIIACDVSRRKMLSVQAMFQEMGATCITPLALNTTDCVIRNQQKRNDNEAAKWHSVQEVLASSTKTKGLLKVSGFYPESFDRILLDPPCSALGLRPKLLIAQTTLKELQQVCLYQRKFVREAVALLKPGGTMTYSTCTFHADENERMVRYILDEYSNLLTLVPALPEATRVGGPGLSGMGLNDTERSYVRRFDPDDSDHDTIGFFVAKFVKQK